MDNPPWTTEDSSSEAVRTSSRGRAFWATVVVIALVFLGLSVRRENVEVFSVQRTDDPRMFLAAPESCNQDASVQVRETSTTVTVSAARNRAFCGGTGDCQEMVQFTLRVPLGDRQVIDGETGQVIGVTRF